MQSIKDPIEYRKRESFKDLKEPGEEEEGPHPEEPDLSRVYCLCRGKNLDFKTKETKEIQVLRSKL